MAKIDPLDQNPLDLVERHFLRAAIIKLRRPRADMIGHLRSLLKLAAVLKIDCDTGRAEDVVSSLGAYLGRPRPPLYNGDSALNYLTP